MTSIISQKLSNILSSLSLSPYVEKHPTFPREGEGHTGITVRPK